jgi:hypothetical protein
LRDGAMLNHVAQYTARQFARAIVMPNLSPPVTTAEEGIAYRDRINAAVPADLDFTPLIVAYLTDHSDADEMARGHAKASSPPPSFIPRMPPPAARMASPISRRSWACSNGCRRSACRS